MASVVVVNEEKALNRKYTSRGLWLNFFHTMYKLGGFMSEGDDGFH